MVTNTFCVHVQLKTKVKVVKQLYDKTGQLRQ